MYLSQSLYDLSKIRKSGCGLWASQRWLTLVYPWHWWCFSVNTEQSLSTVERIHGTSSISCHSMPWYGLNRLPQHATRHAMLCHMDQCTVDFNSHSHRKEEACYCKFVFSRMENCQTHKHAHSWTQGGYSYGKRDSHKEDPDPAKKAPAHQSNWTHGGYSNSEIHSTPIQLNTRWLI